MNAPAEPKLRSELRPLLQTLQERHYALMAAYVDAVRRGSYLPGLLEAGDRSDESDVDSFKVGTSGPLARLLLAIHIRDRLKLVERIYVQLAQTLKPGEDEPYSRWLTTAAAGCDSFGQSMSAAQAGLRALQVPGLSLVAAAVLQRVGFPTLWIVAALALPVAYLLVAVPRSFRMKRELLNPPAGRPGLNDRDRERSNAYRCEAELANCLGYGRPKEGQLDYMVVFVAVALAVGAACLAHFEGWTPKYVVLLPTLLVAGIVVGYTILHWHRRQWR